MSFEHDAYRLRTWIAHWEPPHAVHHDAHRAGEIYQRSTMSALLDGVIEGDTTIAELLTHGDFGLGTFNGLNGEMVVLDGVCHHLFADGTVRPADAADLTPFAAVTWFRADERLDVPTATTRADLMALIDDAIDSENLIYALRIRGDFQTIHTRTVNTPDAGGGLADSALNQSDAVLTDTTGTLAGFRMPDYEQGISVAGYHLHYLADTLACGGHALDFVVSRAHVEISIESDLHLSLPTTGAFLRADLDRKDIDADVRAAEGQ